MDDSLYPLSIFYNKHRCGISLGKSSFRGKGVVVVVAYLYPPCLLWFCSICLSTLDWPSREKKKGGGFRNIINAAALVALFTLSPTDYCLLSFNPQAGHSSLAGLLLLLSIETHETVIIFTLQRDSPQHRITFSGIYLCLEFFHTRTHSLHFPNLNTHSSLLTYMRGVQQMDSIKAL